MPPLTPGRYIATRRTAAGRTLGDVAHLLRTEPPIPLHERIAMLELVEADVQPLTLTDLVAIERAVPLQLGVILALERIRQGQDIDPPRLCRICAVALLQEPVGQPPVGWQGADLCGTCDGIVGADRAAHVGAGR